jgi:hypothetical protein
MSLSFRAEHDYSLANDHAESRNLLFFRSAESQAEQTTTRRVILGPRLLLIARNQPSAISNQPSFKTDFGFADG